MHRTQPLKHELSSLTDMQADEIKNRFRLLELGESFTH